MYRRTGQNDMLKPLTQVHLDPKWLEEKDLL